MTYRRFTKEQIKPGLRMYGGNFPGHHVSRAEFNKNDPVSPELRDAGISEMVRRFEAVRRQIDTLKKALK